MDTTTRISGTAEPLPPPTKTVKVSDADELDVWVVGQGTPIVLVHGAVFGSLLRPLAEQLAKTGSYQAIWYRRRGYNGKPTEPASVPEHARDIVKVLDALGIAKAHVVGHSAGGVFAIALTVEAPHRLLSAAFFDCILAQVESAKMLEEIDKPAIATAQAGDFAGAAETMLAGFGCTKELMDRSLPGAWSGLAAGGRTWFHADEPVFARWTLDAAKFQAADVPMAWLETSPFPPIHDTGQLLKRWKPSLSVLTPPTDHHFFPLTATEETAAVLHGWIGGRARAK